MINLYNFLQNLSGNDLIQIGLKYATLEKKLGEIDRTRGIYSHIS